MPSRPYGIICPLSKASELLEPRWTIQILGEMWGGSSRFNDIRRGVGYISPALLTRRLREMEGLGLIERIEDRATGSVNYFRTAMAIELEPFLNGLAQWAQRNVEAEVAIAAPNISTMMWSARRKITLAELPQRRVVVQFHFSGAARGEERYWLVAKPGMDVDICISDPGTDVDLYVEATPESMAAVMLGRSSISAEVDNGTLFLSGDLWMIRNIDRWFPREDDHDIAGVRVLQRRATVAKRA